MRRRIEVLDGHIVADSRPVPVGQAAFSVSESNGDDSIGRPARPQPAKEGRS
jgi:hypothetical protein